MLLGRKTFRSETVAILPSFGVKISFLLKVTVTGGCTCFFHVLTCQKASSALI